MTIHARLRHLAKHLTRAACNVDGRPLSEPLALMLQRDLYEALDGGRPAHAFLRDADAFPPAEAHAIGIAFAALDRLEPGVRERDQPAMHAAAEVALRIGAAIHDGTSE